MEEECRMAPKMSQRRVKDSQADPLSSSSDSYHTGQNLSRNRQDVVKIFRLHEVYSNQWC